MRHGFALAALALVLAVLAAGPARAGDTGPLEVVFVNLTPQAPAVSQACFGRLRDKVDGYIEKKTWSEDALRRKAGMVKGEPLLTWPAEALQALRREARRAFVLVDCRPGERALDVLVVPMIEGTAHLGLRTAKLDERTLDWAVKGIEAFVEAGHPF